MIELILWTGYLFFFIGIINKSKKLNYGNNKKNYLRASIAFFIPTIPIILYLDYDFFNKTIVYAIILIIITYLIGYFSKEKNTRKDYRFTTAKIFDILFQQSFILLAFILINQIFDSNVILIFATYFLIIHLPMFFLTTRKKAIIYTCASLIGGSIFATVLNYYPEGFWINYSIHFGFYTFAAIKLNKVLS